MVVGSFDGVRPPTLLNRLPKKTKRTKSAQKINNAAVQG
jgi:hypothetical protein